MDLRGEDMPEKMSVFFIQQSYLKILSKIIGLRRKCDECEQRKEQEQVDGLSESMQHLQRFQRK